MAWVPTALTFSSFRSACGIRSPICKNWNCDKLRLDWKTRRLWLTFHQLNWNCDKLRHDFVLRAGNNNNKNDDTSLDYEKIEIEPIGDVIKLEKNNDCMNLKEIVHVPSPSINKFVQVRSGLCSKLAIIIYITLTALILISRKFMIKKRSQNNRLHNQGSISDLVRRGQLKTNRGIISKSYNDPFNNPFVKPKEENSTVEMFGKIYTLTPSKLTKEKQLTHQERRARAYQWKRPEIFLKEGEPVPKDVDPDSVRWIPPNHPFAETTSDLDEAKVKSNLFQRHGVPSQVRAQHETLQKKLDEQIEELNLKNGKRADKPRKELEEMMQVEPNEKKQDQML